VSKPSQKYTKGMGRLNFEKCFVVTPGDFKPTLSEWKKMPKRNFQSPRTIYLGVPISTKVEPNWDWRRVLSKMKIVTNKIKRCGGNLTSRIALINTYLIPISGYLVCRI
jgi:hypothetical protein